MKRPAGIPEGALRRHKSDYLLQGEDLPFTSFEPDGTPKQNDFILCPFCREVGACNHGQLIRHDCGVTWISWGNMLWIWSAQGDVRSSHVDV